MSPNSGACIAALFVDPATLGLLGALMRVGILPVVLVFSLSLTESSAAIPKPYSACRSAADPVTCLMTRAATDTDDQNNLLEAVIFTGSVGLVELHGEKLARAVKERALASAVFMKALGITLPPEASAEQVTASSKAVALAAVALSAAAQNIDDPFSDATVSRLLANANNSPIVAQIALTLWGEADTTVSGAATRN